MPQIVYCRECGAVLYQGEELKSPNEIINMYDDKRCPKCGRELSLTPQNVQVKPAEKLSAAETPGSTRVSRTKRKKLSES